MPNPSFEELTYCPQFLAQFSVADWFNPSAGSIMFLTPDNYHECSVGESGVPQNIVGYQQAKDGQAYAGIILMDALPNAREYLAVKLKSTLQMGKRYYWCMSVNLADSVDWAYNNFGIALTNTMFMSPNDPVFPLTVYDNVNLTITDQQDWTAIGGSFIAHGGENYLYIGNFFDDANTDLVVVQQNSLFGPSAYYFVDDVFLAEYDCTGFFFNIPNVFTPNGDGINDVFVTAENGVGEKRISILNRWGEEVFRNSLTDSWDGTSKGGNCTEGVYFYVINFVNLTNGIEEQKTGVIQLVR